MSQFVVASNCASGSASRNASIVLQWVAFLRQKECDLALALKTEAFAGDALAFERVELEALHLGLEGSDSGALVGDLSGERAALAAYQNVERAAQAELGMEFPKSVQRVKQ